MNLAEVNMSNSATFADIAEHSAWVAQVAFVAKPFATREQMISAFQNAVLNAAHSAQLALIRAHPDLATRAKLTNDSTREQQGAGLEALTPQEFERFTKLNTAYKIKNNFPFIFAVKGATKHQIIEGFETRLHNSAEAEFKTALAQVCRIIRFRLEDRVSE
jgi:2-oxo-4-hydroxy-4-carboxy-5-ureidoimidazoline decarboxylase